jgi:cysteine desulfurase
LIDLNQLVSAITPQTVLVAVMYANNETGVVQPIREIADIIHQKNSIFFCDATQAIGKIPVDVDKDGIDMLCISGHKIYAPKGVGCLYTRRKNPRVRHEQGKRSGTLNVPGIVALGKAVELFAFDISLEKLRNEFEFSLMQHFGNLIQINGKNALRIPNTSNIEFPFKAADFIRQTKTKLAVSTGSACTSAENKPSHVLTAMGLSKENAERCIRFSLGKYTTPADIQSTIEIIKQIQVMKYD